MKISMITLSIGLCALACAVAMGMDGGPPRIDLARFALPGYPRNEVRFEEPRAVREVVVTFARQVPAELPVGFTERVVVDDEQRRAVLLGHGDNDARHWFEQQIRVLHPKIKIVQPLPGKPIEV